MSLTSERMMAVMAYVDGELEGEELAEVEGWLKSDAAVARFANDLAHQGAHLRTAYEDGPDAEAVRSFDVADAVMSSVEKASKQGSRDKVVSLAASRAKKAEPRPADARAKPAPAPSRAGIYIAAALALAASVFLLTRTKQEQPMARAPIVQPAPPSQVASADDDGVSVEVGGADVSVIYLPSEGESVQTSVVVWVDETGGK